MVTAGARRTRADIYIKAFAEEAEKPQEKASEIYAWRRRNREPKVADVYGHLLND